MNCIWWSSRPVLNDLAHTEQNRKEVADACISNYPGCDALATADTTVENAVVVEEEIPDAVITSPCKPMTPIPSGPKNDDDDIGSGGDGFSVNPVTPATSPTVDLEGGGNLSANPTPKETSGPSDCLVEPEALVDPVDEELVDYEESPGASLSLPDAQRIHLESQQSDDCPEVCTSEIYINLKLWVLLPHCLILK